jgi:hypothetical protein
MSQTIARASIILLKGNQKVFRNLCYKPGTFAEKRGDSLKIRFSRAELPFLHMQVL